MTGVYKPPYDLFPVKVEKAEKLTPRMIRLTFNATHIPGLRPDLPGQWVKVFVRDADGGGLHGRAYTIRKHSLNGTIDIDFVLHGDEGQISAWAARAYAGVEFEVSAPHPRSGFAIDPNVSQYVLVADETGLPAVSAILEALPADIPAHAIISVANADEEQIMESQARLSLKWLHRDEGSLLRLSDAIRSEAISPGAAIFIAAEASEVIALRSWIKKQPVQVHLDASGYWKSGEQDHRDIKSEFTDDLD